MKTKNNEISKCTLRESKRMGLHLSTRDEIASPEEKKTPPPQVPPQGEALVNEYVNNLQQQLYMLNAELRFVKDRAGIDVPADGVSVDSAIRRLRKACSMHEEETNTKISEIEQRIAEISNQTKSISRERALETLELANAREIESLDSLEAAFTELYGDIHATHLLKNHYEEASSFHSNQLGTIKQGVDQLKNAKTKEDEEFKFQMNEVDSFKENCHKILNTMNDTIKQRRLNEEFVDVVALAMTRPKKPNPNQTLESIHAKNAKMEIELKTMFQNREEIESQVDQLLEKNVKLKGDLGNILYQLEEAKRLKIEMDKQFSPKFQALQAQSEEQKIELSALKRTRKDMKSEIQSLTTEYYNHMRKYNEIQSETHLIQETTSFKTSSKEDLEQENDKIRMQLRSESDEINELRKELDSLSHQLADASEKKRRVEVIIEINNKDPRCSLESLPPELTQLLDNLNAVKVAIN